MRVPSQEPHPHEEGLKVIELVHEVVDGLCETQDHVAMLQVVQDRVSVSDSVGVHHNMIGEKYLSPGYKSAKGCVDLFHLLDV